MTLAIGAKYDGDWKEDERNGFGVFTWPEGSKYNGEWKSDVRNG